MKIWSISELVLSAISAGIGAAFLYVAIFGESRRVPYLVLGEVGMSLTFFALTISPGTFFQRVKRTGMHFHGPVFRGTAAAFSIIGTIFLVFAALMWAIQYVGG